MQMKAALENKIADFFSLAQEWFLHDVHTDIAIRCEDSSKPILRCHRIIIRDTVKDELGTDLSKLDDEADEIIIPDFTYDHFDTIVRSLYGVDKNVKSETFDFEIKHESHEIKVKIEEDEYGKPNECWGEFLGFTVQDVKTKLNENKVPKVYKCEECDLSFDKNHQLSKHNERKHSDEKFACCICDKQYIRQDKLYRHYKVHHKSKEDKIKIKEANDLMKEKRKEAREEAKKQAKKEVVTKICPFCSKEFHRNDHLTRHLLSHTGEKPHQCGICLKTYTRKDKLNYHYKNEHRNQIFLCYCGKIFLYETEFDEHIKTNPDHYKENPVEPQVEQTKEQDGVYKNPVITESFSLNTAAAGAQQSLNGTSKDGLQLKTERLDADHTDNAAHITPNLSDGACINPGNNTEDVKPVLPPKKKRKRKKTNCDGVENEENTKSKECKCEYCEQVFPTMTKRRRHYISDHLDMLKTEGKLFKKNKIAKVKNLICPMTGCEKAFRHKYEVEDHVNFIHHKQRNYVCELCSKSFPYKKNLKGHMELKHDTKCENILCPKCGDIFGSKAKLSAHIQSKHKVKVARVVSKVKKFQCSYCDYKTYLGAYIKEHERMHTGEKPEICQWCGRGFSSKKTLKDHERLHTGEKPFQCKVCGKAYAQRTNLRLHVRSSHRIELKDLLKDEPPSDLPESASVDVAEQEKHSPHQYRPNYQPQDHSEENVKPLLLFPSLVMELPTMDKMK